MLQKRQVEYIDPNTAKLAGRRNFDVPFPDTDVAARRTEALLREYPPAALGVPAVSCFKERSAP